MVNYNPGPGQYDPEKAETKIKPSKPAYSFGRKINEPRNNGLPGPGSYETDTKGNVKCFSMRSRPCNGKGQHIPGPADYFVKPKVYRNGPEGNQGFTLCGRSQSVNGGMIPGPGSYDYERSIDRVKKRIPVLSFGCTPKNKKNFDYPGPGSYYPSWENDTKACTMGKNDRGHNIIDTPGPGHYRFDHNVYNTGRDTGRIVKLTGRPADHLGNGIPGPGAYSPEKIRQSKNTAFTFTERREVANGDANHPGPGTYDSIDNKTRDSFTMKGKPKDGSCTRNPGPCDYTIPNNLTNRGKQGNSGYLLKGKIQLWKDKSIPGPGTYFPELHSADKKAGPLWSFGEKSSLRDTNNNPGPGAYNPKNGNHINNIKLYAGETKRGVTASKTPAPNQYHIDPKISSKIGKATPAFSLKGRNETLASKYDTPGPGSYISNVNKDEYHGPVFTFGEKGYESMVNSNPGPGQYDPDPMIGKTVRSTKPSLPLYSMGATYRDI